jgi:hypothetical protein
LLVVNADSENHGIRCFILGQVTLEIASFNRAALREVFRIEIKHHPLAFEVFEVDLLAFVCGELKSRRCCSYCRHVVYCTNAVASPHRNDCKREKKSILTHFLTLL